MGYSQININQFKGLNSTISPELIEDGEARDILNFRMEKVGKLVSRNGYICGLFTPPCDTGATRPVCPRVLNGKVDINGWLVDAISPQAEAYVRNRGAIGIGEYVLSERWEELDTDRFMVYVVRGIPADTLEGEQILTSRGQYPKRDFEFYLFSPLTGAYTNQLMTDYDPPGAFPLIGVDFRRDSAPQGMEHTIPLYAPNKRDLSDNATLANNDRWIDHYVDINQYRNQLVISDRINGDMLLENEFDRADLNVCEGAEHKLHLRPNALESFDIDIVEFTPRFQNENTVENGIETGMALYKFVPEKKSYKVHTDYFEQQITVDSLSDSGETITDQDKQYAAMTKLLKLYRKGVSSFFSVYMFYHDTTAAGARTERDTYIMEAGTIDGKFRFMDINGLAGVFTGVTTSLDYVLADDPDSQGPFNCIYRLDTTKYYQFSNAQNPGEFDDLMAPLKFEENEYRDKDGNVVKELAVDAYIWDDYKVKYYPCSGNEVYHIDGDVTDFSRYLKDVDRIFQKLIPGVGRLTELNAKDNAGRKVPLGVWKYRFVWDFGDGVYSAPSAEVVVPDIMWSATQDDDYASTIMGTNDITYDAYPGRPSILSGYDFYKQAFVNESADYDGYDPGIFINNAWEHVLFPRIYGLQTVPMLTKLGEKLHSLKLRLYDITHKYGAQFVNSSDLNDPNLSKKRKGNFGVQMTGYFGEQAANIGRIWQGGAASAIDTWDDVYSPAKMVGARTQINKNILVGSGGLTIPLFSQPGDYITYNSVFDNEGRLRFAYDERKGIKHQLVLPGHNFGIGNNTWITGEDLNAQRTWSNALPVPGASGLWAVLPYCEMLLGLYTGTAGSSIYYNRVVTDRDVNNNEDSLLDLYRSHTIMRGVKSESDRLSYVSGANLPSDVLARLIVMGEIELEVLKRGEQVFFETEKQEVWDVFFSETNYEYKYMIPTEDISDSDNTKWHRRRPGGVYADMSGLMARNVLPGSDWDYYEYHTTMNSDDTDVLALTGGSYNYEYASNLGIYLYGNGERLTAIEQLTAMFPSSILFGAPRLGLKIHSSLIPARAKKLLIFRTKCTHANDYVPTEFGLVEEVDLKRYTLAEKSEHGAVKENDVEMEMGNAFAQMDGGTWVGEDSGEEFYDGLYYFDKVKDTDLDFTKVPINYEGLRKPLKSRFNISIAERTFFLNFIEEYQPLAPRKNEHEVLLDAGGDTIDLRTADAVVMDSENDDGYDSVYYLRYLYVYEDLAGVLSEAKRVKADGTSVYVNGDPTRQVVVLYMMPSQFDGSIKKLRVYRAKKYQDDWAGEPVDYYYIGDVEPGDEGVFLDYGQPGGAKLDCIRPAIFEYESGMMESEPFRPDWIKPEKLYEYRSGDGKVITGGESLFGNIVVYKETSMHRVAVQGKNPAVSRTDEISPNIGCIAPNTLINIDGIHYFLSWKGFMRYDNNQVQKIDGKFDEELQYILTVVPKEYIRDASCGYNAAYNEIYLNIPMLKTNDIYNRQRDYGHGDMYQKNTDNDAAEYFERTLLGHIYVINIEKGYVTKFAYPGTEEDLHYLLGAGTNLPERFVKDIVSSVQMIRLYYMNSMGELRSADVLPAKWDQSLSLSPTADGKRWAGIWIETPYNLNLGIIQGNYFLNYRKIAQGGALSIQEDAQVVLTDYDDILDGKRVPDTTALGYLGFVQPIFPPLTVWPIRSEYRSKFFTGTFETLIKRIRKVIVNIFSRGGMVLKNITTPRHNETTLGDYDLMVGDRADERIENKPHQAEGAEYGYEPSINSVINYAGFPIEYQGIGTNIISCVPSVSEDDDWHGKPIKYSLEIQSVLRTQINSVEIYWRPIHTYIS